MSSGPLTASSKGSSKYLRVFTRLLPLLVLLLAACAGEAGVGYEGTVVEAETAVSSFDDAPNPAGLPPVADAVIELRVCTGGCFGTEPARTTRSRADGSWGPLETAFAGFLGSENHIEVRVRAPGFEPFVYTAIYETTTDPIGGEAYLNVALARE